MPTNAGGTGAIAGDWLGNIVTELASGWNSHRGGRCFAGPVIRFRRGVFFVRGSDPYDGPMPESRQVVSVFAYGMAGGAHRRQVHPGTESPTEPPGPADGKRRLIRGEGLVARISNDYRPQLPVVGKDIPEPAVPCHVGTARLEETVNTQTRSVGRAVRPPYSDRFGGVR